MSDVVISPNMSLPVPVVSQDPGPDWANNVNSCFQHIDQHNHATGEGVQINPAGMNINSDLPINNNNLTTIRSARFTDQVVPLATAADIGCLYESNADLYYNDGVGNQIRITQSGSVTGAAGTITGLPSGTASANYSGGTFTLQSATNTPANFSVGPITIGMNTAGSKTITLTPTAGQPANYTLSFPAASPLAGQVLQSDGSGNFTWITDTIGRIPVGGVVATFPVLTGAYTTAFMTSADASGFVLCGDGNPAHQPQIISDVTSPMNGVTIPNINNSVFIMGSATSGSAGGASTSSALIAHTHGAGSFATTLSGTFASSSHTHDHSHTHQWGYGSTSIFYSKVTSVGNSGTFSTGEATWNGYNLSYNAGATTLPGNLSGYFTNGVKYTTGPLDNAGNTSVNTGAPSATAALGGSNSVGGTSASTGSGSSFSILPPYITAVYLMRIK